MWTLFLKLLSLWLSGILQKKGVTRTDVRTHWTLCAPPSLLFFIIFSPFLFFFFLFLRPASFLPRGFQSIGLPQVRQMRFSPRDTFILSFFPFLSWAAWGMFSTLELVSGVSWRFPPRHFILFFFFIFSFFLLLIKVWMNCGLWGPQ